ncbi:MAG TPA: hypothetical protein ENF68_00105 [bacterium]|nr:hypothetical protein [bacterium]
MKNYFPPILTKIREFVKKYQEDIVLFIGVVLISLLSFAVGYIVGNEKKNESRKAEQTYEDSHYWRRNLRIISCLEVVGDDS